MISVISLVYRENQDLVEGLEALLAQDYTELDIVVIDLCDTAGSRELAQKAKALDKRVRICCAQHGNLAEVYNAAIEQAQGEYIVFLTPNTRLAPKSLSKMFELLESDKNLAFAYSNYEVQSAEGIQPKALLEDIQDDTEMADFGLILMYRMAHLKEIGGYDEDFSHAEEYDLRLRLTDRYRLGHIDEVLYRLIESKSGGKVSVGASELFFPGEGEYGGFSYLFYDKDAEREIETAFKNMLRRKEVYLEHENVEVSYAPDEQFEPLVSVIIPTYNRAQFIGRSIQSALDQTFDDYEIIVVDNGSTDGTVQEAKKFAGDKVRVIKNEYNTIAFALNTGINASKAKYYAQLDSDDAYDPRTLELMTEHLENNPKTAMAISYYDLIDIDDNPLTKFGVIKHLEYDRNNILRVNGAGALRVWHRKAVLEMGGFNEGEFANYGEDYDMVTRLSEKYNIGRVHHVLYHYRRHADNTDAVRDPQMNIRLKTRARHYAYERRKKLNERLRQA